MSVSAGGPVESRAGLVTGDAFDEAAPSLVSQILEGWELMAEAVAESDPSLASLMSSGTLVARAAFAQEVPSFMAQLRAYLADTGLTPEFQEELMGEVSRLISEPPSAFTLDWLMARHEQAVSAFIEGRGVPENDSGNFLAAAASAAIRAGLGRDQQNPSSYQQWRIIAALEQPNKIHRSGSLFCAASWRFRRNVRLKELTYQDIEYQSTPSGDVRDRQWVTLQDSSGSAFPRDFDSHETPDFAKTILGDTDGAAYLLQLNLGGNLAPLASEFMEAHERDILGLAEILIQPAKALVPILHCVPASLLAAVPKLLTTSIKKIIQKRLGDRTLPSWVIHHTVLKADGEAPVSIVLLRSPEQANTAKATLAGTKLTNGEMEQTRNYEGYQVVELGPRGRFIDGATLPANATDPVPVEVNDRIWNLVADKGQPIVWSDCWESGEPTHGFRALVPFARFAGADQSTRRGRRKAKKKTQAYVAALRVEVYPVAIPRRKPRVYHIE